MKDLYYEPEKWRRSAWGTEGNEMEKAPGPNCFL